MPPAPAMHEGWQPAYRYRLYIDGSGAAEGTMGYREPSPYCHGH
jgi:hypothetical protein